MSEPPNRVPPLIVIEGSRAETPLNKPFRATKTGQSGALDVQWSILMARAQDGDAGAYRRLLTEITPKLRALAARRHRDPNDAEDAVQDILLTLHAVRQTYDPTRPFMPWLVTIANRRIVDRLRQRRRARSRETALTPKHETSLPSRTNIEIEVAERRELNAALQQLSASQRQVVHLLKLEQLSLKEAAAKTGMSVGALKVALHRALKNLRKVIAYRGNET